MRQLLLDFTQAPAPTFANYVHGRNAELAHALEAAARGAPAERVIYMWGESAAGKTHLLKAFAAAAGNAARYVPGADLSAEDARGVLALDDVERLAEARQVELFNAFNEKAFSLLVVAATAAPRDVPLRRDLATRLASPSPTR
jgi:DnaA family protein